MSDWTSVATAKEEAYSVEESVRYTGENHARVVLRCPWADRGSVLTDLIAPSGALTRAYPNLPIGALVASAAIKPAPQSGQSAPTAGGRIVYDEALITVDYDCSTGRLESGTHPDLGVVLYTESLEPSIRSLSLDHRGFCWGSNTLGPTLTEHEAPTRIERLYKIVRTLYQLPSIDSSILTLPGKTNQAAYVSASLGLTFPIETLLFDTPSMQRTVKSDGTKAWTLTLKFAYQPDTWNKWWRKNKSGADKYDTIFDIANATVYKEFPPGDFSKWLF